MKIIRLNDSHAGVSVYINIPYIDFVSVLAGSCPLYEFVLLRYIIHIWACGSLGIWAL